MTNRKECSKLYTEEQIKTIIDELEHKISNAGVYANGNEGLLYQGIKSAFRDVRSILEDTKNE